MRTFVVDPEGIAKETTRRPELDVPEPEFNSFRYTPRDRYQYRGPFSPPGRSEADSFQSPVNPARFFLGLLLWFSPLLLVLWLIGPKSEDDPYVFKTAPGGRTVIDEAATARNKRDKLLRDSRRVLEARKPPQYATVEQWRQAVRNNQDSLKLIQASVSERFGSGGNKRWGDLYMQAADALKRGDRQEAARILKVIQAERAARIQQALKIYNTYQHGERL